MLAIFVERGGADGLELPPCQHWLEDRGSINRAFSSARTNEGVDLIDEEHDVAAGVDFLEDLLEAFLKITAIARSGHEGAKIEGVDLLVLESLGHIATDNVLGKPFDDGGLADARLTDQDWVVLGAARQDLHHALDLGLTPNHGVKLGLTRGLSEIAAELIEHHVARRRSLGGSGCRLGLLAALVAADQLDHLLTHAI